jgi:hypothetical protein
VATGIGARGLGDGCDARSARLFTEKSFRLERQPPPYLARDGAQVAGVGLQPDAELRGAGLRAHPHQEERGRLQHEVVHPVLVQRRDGRGDVRRYGDGEETLTGEDLDAGHGARTGE